MRQDKILISQEQDVAGWDFNIALKKTSKNRCILQKAFILYFYRLLCCICSSIWKPQILALDGASFYSNFFRQNHSDHN